MIGAVPVLTNPSDRIQRGGGVVKANNDGSITVAAATGKSATLTPALSIQGAVVGALEVTTGVTLVSGHGWNISRTRQGYNMTAAGGAGVGSANEAIETIHANVTGVTNSLAAYEKIGLYVTAQTSDPAQYGPLIERDLAAIDTRGMIASGNTLGRAFGIYAGAYALSGGDGYLVAGEFESQNNGGTDQASLGTSTSKIALHAVAGGTAPSTAAVYIDHIGTNTFHHGVWADPSALGTGTTDSFLELNGRFTVFSSGKITANMETGLQHRLTRGTPTVVDDTADDQAFWYQATDFLAAGTAVVGSANQFGTVSEVNVSAPTSSAAAYEKAGILSIAETSDPSQYSPSTITRDVVGVDGRGYIKMTVLSDLGRAWGVYAVASAVNATSDGLLIGIEAEIRNNGTDQASLGTTTSKYGVNSVAYGPVAGTAAVRMAGANSARWHHGLVMNPADLGTASTDTFIQLVGLFVVGNDGRLTIGAALQASRLYVIGTSFGVDGVVLSPTLSMGVTGKAVISSSATIVPTAGYGDQYGMLFIPGIGDGTANAFSITNVHGLFARIDTRANYSGTITSAYIFHAVNASKVGSGAITTQYGLYVDSLTSGATNWAVFTAGTTPSSFGGVVTALNLPAQGMPGLIYPAGFQAASLAAVTVLASATCQVQYIGRAMAGVTSIDIVVNVTTAFVSLGGTPWCEFGVFKGVPVANGNVSLTRLGSVDTSAIVNTTGRKKITVTCSGGAAGDDLWIVYGCKTTGTVFQIRGGLADDIQSGAFQTMAAQPSLASSPQATTLAGATVVPAWLACKIT